jgi:hypothetical protein
MYHLKHEGLRAALIGLKGDIVLDVLWHLHTRDLFGMGKKCWACLVTYSLGYHDWGDVMNCRGPLCNYCGRYCRKPCPRDCKVCGAESPCGVGEKTFGEKTFEVPE